MTSRTRIRAASAPASTWVAADSAIVERNQPMSASQMPLKRPPGWKARKTPQRDEPVAEDPADRRRPRGSPRTGHREPARGARAASRPPSIGKPGIRLKSAQGDVDEAEPAEDGVELRLRRGRSRCRSTRRPITRLEAGPATAMSASARGVRGVVLQARRAAEDEEGDVGTWTPKRRADQRVTQLVGEHRAEEERRDDGRHEPVQRRGPSRETCPAGCSPPASR